MLSPRRSAQLGLGAACLILVSSVAVLVAGASDYTTDNSKHANAPISRSAGTEGESQATPAVSSLSASLGVTQTMAVAERQ